MSAPPFLSAWVTPNGQELSQPCSCAHSVLLRAGWMHADAFERGYLRVALDRSLIGFQWGGILTEPQKRAALRMVKEYGPHVATFARIEDGYDPEFKHDDAEQRVALSPSMTREIMSRLSQSHPRK